MKSNRWLTVCGSLIVFSAMILSADAKPEHAQASSTPVEYQRGTEQTFLTYPEWFLVYSPAEYADYVKTRRATEFPFLGHIRQFWQSYGKVYEASNEGYPFNFGYHVMIVVIGTSTTIEYGIRSAYETLIGRLSEATQSGSLTEEDIYGAKIAQDYVDFIRVRPWYEYDFNASLKGLWSDTSYFGTDNIRKWERKYALTTEYLAKSMYGWVIMKATKASYDAASDQTAIILDRMPADTQRALPQLEIVRQLPDKQVLATVPRYQAFTTYAEVLASQDHNFVEIAGNRGPILLTILCSSTDNVALPGTKILFQQPILTKPGLQRIGMIVTVPELAKTLKALRAKKMEVEHVYDY